MFCSSFFLTWIGSLFPFILSTHRSVMSALPPFSLASCSASAFPPPRCLSFHSSFVTSSHPFIAFSNTPLLLLLHLHFRLCVLTLCMSLCVCVCLSMCMRGCIMRLKIQYRCTRVLNHSKHLLNRKSLVDNVLLNFSDLYLIVYFYRNCFVFLFFFGHFADVHIYRIKISAAL